MACVGRTKECTIVPPNHFGPVPGGEVGMMWKFRVQVRGFSHHKGARCSSVVRAFAHGAMGRWIDPSWGGPIELFLVPASAPRLV